MNSSNSFAYELLKSEKVVIRDALISSVHFELKKGIMNASIELNKKSNAIDLEKILIKCIDIIKMDYWVFNDDPAYLEDYKLFYNSNFKEYYLSLDPDNSVKNIIDTDCNILIFKKLSLFVANNDNS